MHTQESIALTTPDDVTSFETLAVSLARNCVAPADRTYVDCDVITNSAQQVRLKTKIMFSQVTGRCWFSLLKLSGIAQQFIS